MNRTFVAFSFLAATLLLPFAASAGNDASDQTPDTVCANGNACGPAPTVKPSVKPTAAPTAKPTTAPTAAPTAAPTPNTSAITSDIESRVSSWSTVTPSIDEALQFYGNYGLVIYNTGESGGSAIYSDASGAWKFVCASGGGMSQAAATSSTCGLSAANAAGLLPNSP